MKAQLKQKTKSLFNIFGIEIHKLGSTKANPYILGYVAAKPTIEAASEQNLSVSDYLETLWNHKDNRYTIINEINQFGVFNQNIKNTCEIGTGAGLYVEKTIELCQPLRYESYEPDKDWSEWLAKEYKITSHDSDGKSLSYTSTSSIDLVLAHGVFVYLPFLVAYGYFQEIVRVVKDSDYVVFDIVSEDCLDPETIEKWLKSEQIFPQFSSKEYVINFFEKYNFSLIGEFFNNKYNVGKSQYLIFKRRG